MYCTKCGTQNYDSSLKCVQCGDVLRRPQQFGAGAARTIEISNYLIQAILVTIFCCMPFGIPAIVFAAQVNSKVDSGDYKGAIDSSKQAKMWCWISFGIGLTISIIYLLFIVAGFIQGFTAGRHRMI
jgi:uncharacterized membrane protein YvbJ